MTELQLFEEWCSFSIQIQEEVEKQMDIAKDPKWMILQSGNRSNKHECKAALEMIKKFKEYKNGDSN